MKKQTEKLNPPPKKGMTQEERYAFFLSIPFEQFEQTKNEKAVEPKKP